MKKVLIVEDEEAIAESLSKILTRFDYTVAKSGSVSEAEGRISEYTPDIVFLDINLPDGSGTELIPVFRKRIAQVVIIVMSAYYDYQEELPGEGNHTADFFLSKPFGMSDLAQALEFADKGKL